MGFYEGNVSIKVNYKTPVFKMFTTCEKLCSGFNYFKKLEGYFIVNEEEKYWLLSP